MSYRSMRLGRSLAVWTLVLVACVQCGGSEPADSAQHAASAADAAEGTDSTATAEATSQPAATPSAAPDAAPTETTAAPEPTLTPTAEATATPVPEPTAAPHAAPSAATTGPVEPGNSIVLQASGPRVTAAVYPRPDYPGDPWSQWGQAVVLPDGRVISAIGDHLGRGGNSYVYAYDPQAGTLDQVVDVLQALDHPSSSWGFGKIHSQMVLADNGDVYFTTYWGTRRDLEFDDAYRGDVLMRLDPAGYEVESLGVPVPRHGIPSLAGDGRYLYGEALDPLADGNVGGLFVFDTSVDELVTWIPDRRQAQFRNVIVDGAGADALVASADADLLRYDLDAAALVPSGIDLGDRLRASTRADAAGTVYAVTNGTDEFFAIPADGTTRSLGNAPAYTTSLALTPDESAFLYVPGAHGSSPSFGTPLIAVDVATGEQTTLVELDAMARDALDLVLGGSFSVAVDPVRGLAHIGFNAGPTEDSPWGEIVQVTVELDGATSPTPTDPAPTDPAPTAAGPAAAPARLEDITDEYGLVEPLTGLHGHAVAVADVNGDGWDDLFVGTFADRPTDAYALRGARGPKPDRLLLGGPDGFVLDDSFPGRLARSSGAVFADLDNDGDPDLIVSRNVRNESTGTEIYRNDGGTFTSVLILDDSRGGRAVDTLDYDGDGLLDIYLVEDRWSGGSSVLFRNRGDFRFVDRTRAAGLPDDVFGLGLGIADLDGNGADDLVIGGSNRIFLGDGAGGFTESTGADLEWEIFGPEDDVDHVAIGDIDGDGDLDIVLGHHYNSTLDFDEEVPVRLYLNDGTDAPGNLMLRDVTDAAGLIGLPTKAPKVMLVDMNADGLLDIVTTASAAGGSRPAVFHHRGVVDGVPRFTPPTALGDAQYWIDGAVIDADGDGRNELFLVEWEPALPSLLFGIAPE